jgi:hypothetical protein
MANDDAPIIAAHKHCRKNQQEVLASEACGCFYCLRIFSPGEITEWHHEPDKAGVTAFCPYCGIDSVIGTGSGYPITPTFLAEMQKHWFSKSN